MELRIKKEHLGKIIGRGNDTYILTSDLSQKQLMFIKNMVSSSFVEDVIEKPIEVLDEPIEVKPKKKKKKNVEDK